MTVVRMVKETCELYQPLARFYFLSLQTLYSLCSKKMSFSFFEKLNTFNFNQIYN